MSVDGTTVNIPMLEEGQGLWQQIDNSHKRAWILHTGTKGHQLFENSFKRISLNALLEAMTDDFTSEEMISMKKMIDSEDMENLEVAHAIIDVKLKA